MVRARHAERLKRGPGAVLQDAEEARSGPAVVEVGAYERISDDQEDVETGDRGAGVERQREAIELLCASVSHERQTWQIKGHHVDNDISAFKDVVRPEFERLLADLEDGVIDGIVVYDLDRLARRPRDLERVIDVYDAASKAGRRLVFRTVHDAIDLSSPDGITLARVMVAFANKASRDTSRRVAAKHRATALTGRPVSGTRPFGWDWVRAEVRLADGRVLPKVTEPGRKGNQAVNEFEANVIRRAAEDLLAGVALNTIVKDLNKRQVKTSRGNAWSAATLKQMLLAPRLAGYRVHQGEILVDPKTTEFVRGQWDPILDEGVWTSLEELLLAEGRTGAERRSEAHREYFLSGLLRCSECQGPLHGNARSEKHFYYACKARGGGPKGEGGCGKISASGVAVDDVISQLLKARMRAATVEVATESAVWPREGELQARRAELRAKFTDYSELSGDAARMALAAVQAAQEDVDELLQERSDWLKNRLRAERQVEVGPDTWDGLPVRDRRQYARAELQAIYVLPSTRRGNRFDPSRLVPVWRELVQEPG